MPAIAREKWSSYEYGGVTSAAGYTITGATDEHSALAAAGLPVLNSSHPRNVLLRAEQPIVRKLTANGSTWEATVRWSIPQSGGEHLAPGTDPLAQPMEVEWQRGEESEAIDRDMNGVPIANSARDAFEGETGSTIVRYLRVFKNLPFYEYEKWVQFEDTVNAKAVSLISGAGKKIIIPAGVCRVLAIEPAGRFTIPCAYVRMMFYLGFKGFPWWLPAKQRGVTTSRWQRWRLDQGMRAWYQDGATKKIGPIVTTTTGSKVDLLSSPVRLDGRGKPMLAGCKVTSIPQEPIALAAYPPPPKGPVTVTREIDGDKFTYLVYQQCAGADFLKLGIFTP